jgi:bifunctional non-homologous end joining protein LigD
MVVQYRAQLALLVDEPPSGSNWLHELKLDGYRIGVLIERKRVRLMSRRGTEWTAEFPELVESAEQLRLRNALIDGEVVMLDERGISSFAALQQRRLTRGSLGYFAFDLLVLDGRDVSRQPLIDRKNRLRTLVGDGVGIIRYTEHFEDDGKQVLRQACALGAEGIVSKRRDAPYRWAARHADWRKSKCSKRQEFVVGGFTDPKGSRVGVGSLLIGYYEADELRFAGKVGTGRGWSAAFGRELRKKLERIETKTSPFDPRPPVALARKAHWVKPMHVVEVEFTEWTAGGHARHPSLQGFREDKEAREVRRETPVVPSRVPAD